MEDRKQTGKKEDVQGELQRTGTCDERETGAAKGGGIHWQPVPRLLRNGAINAE